MKIEKQPAPFDIETAKAVPEYYNAEISFCQEPYDMKAGLCCAVVTVVAAKRIGKYSQDGDMTEEFAGFLPYPCTAKYRCNDFGGETDGGKPGI